MKIISFFDICTCKRMFPPTERHRGPLLNAQHRGIHHVQRQFPNSLCLFTNADKGDTSLFVDSIIFHVVLLLAYSQSMKARGNYEKKGQKQPSCSRSKSQSSRASSSKWLLCSCGSSASQTNDKTLENKNKK